MIKPVEIKQEIKKRPPLQREEAQRHYHGLHVNWKVKFKTAFLGSSGALVVRTEPTDEMYPDIYFDAPKKLRAEFNLLQEDAPLWIDAEIEAVTMEGLRINLKSSKIGFHEGDMRNMSTPPETLKNQYNITQIHHGIGSNTGNNIEGGVSIQDNSLTKKGREWYEKPLGIILLMVVATVVATGIVFYLRWN